MALPLPPRNLNPIPNSPFYYPNEEALASSTGPLIVGAGLAVDYTSGQLQASTGGLANVSATLPLYKTGTVSNPVINIETANKFRLGAVQVGTNLNLSGVGVIDVLQSTTTQKGIVQLADNTSSTSKFLALTANQGYLLQQQINSLSFATDLIFSGTFDPTVPEMVNVTTKGQEAGFVQGANLP
ncbi:MAG: tail fiber protein, partial [Prochlorotrichaceae cyanobacterium]